MRELLAEDNETTCHTCLSSMHLGPSETEEPLWFGSRSLGVVKHEQGCKIPLQNHTGEDMDRDMTVAVASTFLWHQVVWGCCKCCCFTSVEPRLDIGMEWLQPIALCCLSLRTDSATRIESMITSHY